MNEAREVELGVGAGCDGGGAAGGVVLSLDEVVKQGLLLHGCREDGGCRRDGRRDGRRKRRHHGSRSDLRDVGRGSGGRGK